VTTNGSLLTEATIRGLVDARVDLLRISLQMMDEKAHQGRGSRQSFEEYCAGIMNAIELLTELDCGMDVVLIVMNTSTRKLFDVDRFVSTNGNRSEIKKKLLTLFLNTFAAVGREVSREEVETAVGRLSLLKPRLIRIDERVAVSVIPFVDWGNAFTSRNVHPTKIGCCGYALSSVGVLSNGEVTICCADYDGRTSLGNLRTESLASLLSSEKTEAIRDGFRKMRIVHPHCQRCIGSTNGILAVLKGLASVGLFSLLRLRPTTKLKEMSLVPA